MRSSIYLVNQPRTYINWAHHASYSYHAKTLHLSLRKDARAASLDKEASGIGSGGAIGRGHLEVALGDAAAVGPEPGQGDGVASVESDGVGAAVVAGAGAAGLEGRVAVGPGAVGGVAGPQVAPVVNVVAGAREGVGARLLGDEEALQHQSGLGGKEGRVVGQGQVLRARRPVGGAKGQGLQDAGPVGG